MSGRPTDEEQKAYVDWVNSIPVKEREAYLEQQHLEIWGVTIEQFWNLTASEIHDIATARGLTVAGIGKGGEYSHKGDDKDHRN